MTCKFVLKCSIREKLLVDNNELIKAVAEIFSVKIVFVFSLNTLYIHIYIYTYIHIYKINLQTAAVLLLESSSAQLS